MDIHKIKNLIELLQETGVAEIEIHEGKESVRITRENVSAPLTNFIAPILPDSKTMELQLPQNTPVEVIISNADKHTVRAHMVGTVYLAPTPGAKHFVEVGKTVKVGDVICLIEAMKMFNQIEADKAGKIAAILIENGTAVEFNQPLFTIE